MNKKLIVVLSLSVLFLASCKVQDELDDLDGKYDPEFALPLFFSKFSLRDIVGSDNATALKLGANGKMNFYYKSTFTERKATDVLNVFQGASIPIVFTDTTTYLPILKSSEMTITRIDYKKGSTISVAAQLLTPNISEPVKLKMWIPTLIKNGKYFEVNYTGQLPTTTLLPIVLGNDLFGYTLTPSPAGSDSILIRYNAFTTSGTPVKLNFVGAVGKPSFNYIEGYMQKRDIKIDNGSVDVSIYNNTIKGDLKFEEPRISILIENSYGYPMRTKVNLVKAISKKGDTIALRSTDLINDGFDFPHPTLSEVGQTKYKRFDFTNANSNIRDLLNAAPNTVLYSIDAVANPEGNAKQIGFMTDSTTLKIGLEVDIPLYGSASNFKAEDTINNIDLTVLENAKSAELKFVSDNELPVAINLQGYFLDAQGKVLDKVQANTFRLVNAAEVDAAGNVTKAAHNEVFIPLDEAKIALIKGATRLAIDASFDSSQNGTVPVRVLSTQNVNLRAGIKVHPKF